MYLIFHDTRNDTTFYLQKLLTKKYKYSTNTFYPLWSQNVFLLFYDEDHSDL